MLAGLEAPDQATRGRSSILMLISLNDVKRHAFAWLSDWTGERRWRSPVKSGCDLWYPKEKAAALGMNSQEHSPGAFLRRRRRNSWWSLGGSNS